MAAYSSSNALREIAATSQAVPRWKEITINTGGSASILQDIKLADSAGGFTYADSGCHGSLSANRFIYWRCIGDGLDLIEESLNYDLTDNHLRLRFMDTPVLSGAGLYEYRGHVVLLVATVTSVHRVLFPHPSKMQKSAESADRASLPSIFTDASLTSVHEPRNVHMINDSSSLPYHVHAASTWLTQQGEAIFAYATNMASTLVVKMPTFGIQGVVTQHELSRSSVIHRIWSGIVPAAIRGIHEPAETVLSLCLFSLYNIACVASVGKDHTLRLWSLKNHDCVLVRDMVDMTGMSHALNKNAGPGSGHVIKTSLDSDIQSIRLVIYLSLPNHSLIVIVEPDYINGSYHVNLISSCLSGNDDLVDFCVTSTHIWLLSNDKSGHPMVKSATFNSDGTVSPWFPVHLDTPLSSDIFLPNTKDPRELYMDLMFHPSHFSTQDIHKALLNYRKSLDTVCMDSEVTIGHLKEQVSLAVEAEIQNCVGGCEIPEEQYYQIQVTEWSKLYSGCIQYNKIGNKAKGLMADNNTGLACLIKKANISYVAACDVIDQLYVASQDPSLLPSDDQSDLEPLFACLRVISDNIPDDVLADFDLGLDCLEPPDLTLDRLVSDFIYADRSEELSCLSEDIVLALQDVPDLLTSIHSLHTLLDISQTDPDSRMQEEATAPMPATRHLSSHLGAHILSTNLSRLTQSRFAVARNLLILEKVALLLADHIQLARDRDYLMVDLIPVTVSLVRAYFTMNAMCQFLVTPPPSRLDLHLHQLSALDLTDRTSYPLTSDYSTNQTIIDLFVKTRGGTEMRALEKMDGDPETGQTRLWGDTLVPYTLRLAQLLWPVSSNFLFPEFLLGHSQFVCIAAYTRLLQDWCEVNSASRNFLLAQAYLNSNEPYKAAECFKLAEAGVKDEHFLYRNIVRGEGDVVGQADTGEAQMARVETRAGLGVLYYLKVIELFEHFHAYDVIVTLAVTAINVTDPSDQNLPTLWSKVFKYELELGHYKDAYTAMISNPEECRRKDCLRQFIVVLCEKKELQTLIEFPYTHLHDDVVDTLETKARSVDLSMQNYYDLLYAFHVSRGNFRTAGSVMYEYGMRLGQELPTLDGLQRQAKCYVAALNVLRLANPDYAWVIKPTCVNRRPWEDPSMVLSKRFSDGEEKPYSKTKIELLELGDIEKEYLLVKARLQLTSSETGPLYRSDEMVGQLVNAGLFDQAIVLCRAFTLPLTSVVEGLAMRCVALSQQSTTHTMGGNSYTSKAWDWLNENDLGFAFGASEATSNSTDCAWHLLESYLVSYESNTSRLHQSVAVQLLSHGFPLPSWFITSYKKLNPAELLHLYMSYDLLEEATQLCVELVDAVRDVTRGQDRPMLGLSGMVSALPQSVWLPYTYIDQLLYSLEQLSNDVTYTEMGRALRVKVTDYQTHLEKLLKMSLHKVEHVM